MTTDLGYDELFSTKRVVDSKNHYTHEPEDLTLRSHDLFRIEHRTKHNGSLNTEQIALLRWT